MEFFVNCNTSGLAPYTVPLDQQRIQHVYRRLGFSASVQTVNSAPTNAGTLIDQLINEALSMPLMTPPEWADWNNADYPADDDLRGALRRAHYEEMRITYGNALVNNNLRDRLSFFWSNHFVTELEVYDCPSFLFHYLDCLQRNALGNFKTFTSEIGLTSAMLYYLDGAYNNGDNPNENYARELYELFTLGEGQGYTEQDIIETARALSGYVERGEEGCTAVTFDPAHHDTGTKTILGRTGNWDYDDVIDILFEERGQQVAQFICTKLYKFFVHPDAESVPAIIDEMAATFVANNFELEPVLAQLFKSQHFFDDEAIGVIIKSPFDLFFNFLNESDFAHTDDHILHAIDSCGLLGQVIFDPNEVQGWQRDRQWINTNFMIGRWLTIEQFILDFFNADQDQFRSLAMDLVGGDTSNPRIVVQAFVDKFTPKGLLTPEDFQNALSVFTIEDVPQDYYGSDYIPGGQGLWILSTSMEVPTQVYLLLIHLSRQPEFQLK